MKVISASLSPNTDARDVWQAMKMVMTPWRWKKGKSVPIVESWFRKQFDTPIALSFNSGRSAMLALLHAFGIGAGDEVIVQAFSCVAVPNSVLWAGATPVYVDIDDRFNIDSKALATVITPRTKAIIVQHTLGIPAQMENIMAIAKKHNVLVIEDCAHALGATEKGKQLGTWGDAAFFSFGRDKVISSVFGGIAIVSKKQKTAQSALRSYHASLRYPTFLWIYQQLIHPIVFAIALPLYPIGIGKIIVVVFQKLRLLGFPVYPKERRGERPRVFPTKYPNALAFLLVPQLKKLETLIATRRERADVYAVWAKKHAMMVPPHVPGAGWLRYPVLVKDPDGMRARAKKKGVLLGNWYHNTIDPTGVDFARVGYIPDSCPNAEHAAAHVINFPTTIRAIEQTRVLLSTKE